MTITRVKGNTFALEDSQCIGLYQIDDRTCILLDPASKKYLNPIETILQERNLTPVGILCTHMHYDHHETSLLPFAFDIGEDLASKELLAALDCDAYILCHSGVIYGSCAELARKNIALFEQKTADFKALLTKPMPYSTFHSAVLRSVGLTPGHPVRAMHFERYIRPYWDYLIDTEQVELVEVDGAAAIMQKQR